MTSTRRSLPYLITPATFLACNEKNVLLARVGARRLMAWPPSFESLSVLCNAIISTGCTSVLSIGCGTGTVEWLINSLNVLPEGIRAADLWDRDLIVEAKMAKLNFVSALDTKTNNPMFLTPKDCESLVFFYPVPPCMVQRYIDNYKGQCIVLAPTNIEEEEACLAAKKLVESKMWVQVLALNWEGKKPTVVSVFRRKPDFDGQ